MNWTERDLKLIGEKLNLNATEFEELVEREDFIKIAEAGDYEAAYKDYLEAWENPTIIDFITFKEFMDELKEGYGHEGMREIARLICLSHGIYYDREYC